MRFGLFKYVFVLVKEDGPLHVRGVSAPQADWWKQVSENHSLESWVRSVPSTSRLI